MKKSGSKPAKEQIKRQDVKQAVIVDYKVLGVKCPGRGVSRKPLIQYSLEWLLIEQFDEIFICCLPENAQQLRDFVKLFLKIDSVPPTTSIQVHSSEGNISTGDCLRDLDSKALIKADFVIMDVGCCGNLSLTELLEAHKTLKKSDKNAILTSILRNVYTKNPTEFSEFPIYVSDPKTGLLLHYVEGRVSKTEAGGTSSKPRRRRRIGIPTTVFSKTDSIKLHRNLCSTNLSIYSAIVPALFTELIDTNSEAELIQRAFYDYDIAGRSVYVHIVDDLFSQRMADFGFVINQKWDKFDTNLIYKRDHRSQVLKELVNDSLRECTKIHSGGFLAEPDDDTCEDEDDDDIGVDDDDDHEEDLESSEESGESISDEASFLNEVLGSLVDGFKNGTANEDIILAINASKPFYDIGIDDVNSIVAKALLLIPEKLDSTKSKDKTWYWKTVKESIDKFKKFLLSYLKSGTSRRTFLLSMEHVYLSREREGLTDVVLANIVMKLYEIDALDEESILGWYYSKEIDDRGKQMRGKPSFKRIVDELEADTEEEDDESDG